jgi:DNA helicase IV
LAVERHKLASGATPTIEMTYDYLRTNSVAGQPLSRIAEWSTYLRGLPPYRQARTLRCHWPLLAYVTWEVAPPAELQSIRHVIVDEAQDVSEMEWYLLARINRGHAWTILGDLNQRRSDHTHANWSKIFDVLTLATDTPVRRLERGYRSTKPILEFANRLLPRAERSFEAFQSGGVTPAVTKKRPNELGDAVVDEVARLISNYPSGSVAVISVTPDLVHRALRKRDWRASGNDMRRWQWGESVVTVLEPDAARGLEFDAVVVVEPSDFPTNYGRQGPLYTALTRGNRELSVFHSKSLPDALRRR